MIEEMSDFSTEEGWRAAGWHEVRVYLGMSEEKVNELVVAGWQPVDLLWASTEGLAELHLAILTKSRIAAAIAKVRAPSVGGVPSDYDVYKQGVSAVRVFVGEQKDLLRFIYDVEMNVKVGSCVGGIRVRVAMNRMDGDAKKWLLMKEKRNERFPETDAGWVQMKEEMNSLWMYVDEEQDALDAIAEMEWDPKTMDGSSFVVRFLSCLLGGGIVDEGTQVKMLKTKIGVKARKYLKQKNPAATWSETVKALKEFEASIEKMKKTAVAAIDEGVRSKAHIQCFACKEYGHYSSGCPKKLEIGGANGVRDDHTRGFGRGRVGRGGGGGGRGRKECFRCGLLGHMSYDCTAPSPSPHVRGRGALGDRLIAALASWEELQSATLTPPSGSTPSINPASGYIEEELVRTMELVGHETAENEGSLNRTDRAVEMDVVVLQGGAKPRVWIRVAGAGVEALVDSGACVSVIDTIVLEGLAGVKRGIGKGRTLRTADGTEFVMDKDATLEIDVGGVKLDWTFQVSPKKLPASVIIGWDLIQQLDMRILPRQGLVKIFGENGWSQLEMKDRWGLKERELIRSSRSVVLPAGVTAAIAYSRDRGKQEVRSMTDWEIQEVSGEWDRMDKGELLMLRGVRGKNDQQSVFVHNNSDKPIVIAKGRILGLIQEFSGTLLAPILEEKEELESEESVKRKQEIDVGIKWARDNMGTPKMNQSGGWEGRPSHEFIIYDPDGKLENQKRFREFILAEGADRFEESITGVSKLEEMAIDLLNERETVVWRPGARVPYKWRSFVEEKLMALGKIGAIRSSTSSFSAPVLVVPKAGGGLRMVIDYRGLNLRTIAVHGLLPSPEDLFLKMRGCKFISVFDSTDGYHQQRLRAGDEKKTAFSCHMGQFEYTRVPQGLKNAPRYYNEAMTKMLGGLKEFCNVYFDDICVFSQTFEEHLEHLRKVFSILRRYNVSLKGSKSKVGWKEVKYLGHIVSGEGLKIDPEKGKAIRGYKRPQRVDELGRFISMAGYYRKFIDRFADYEGPLRALMKRSSFGARKSKRELEWDELTNNCFNSLKLKMEDQMLIHPDWRGKFAVKVDSSERGWGAVLLQEGRVVEYASGTFSDCQRRYGPCERETLGVILALEKWKNYLVGGKAELFCDCRALKWLAESQNSSSKLWRWAMRLTEFDVKVTHIPGREMEDVDALSRAPLEEIVDDPTDIATIQIGEEGERWRKRVLKEAHEGFFSGHPGSSAMIELLRNAGAKWPGWRADVKRYVKECSTCQLAKARHSREKSSGSGSMKSVDGPFKRIWVDIVPVGKELVGTGDAIHPSGCRYVLVIVDDHSRWVELVPLRRTNVESVAMALMSRWFVAYGVPEEIVSDATNILDGKEASKVWEKHGIEKIRVAPYHQASNGLVERAIGTMVNILRCWIGVEGRRWVELLPMVAGVMRNRVGSATGRSPYQILFGRNMSTPLQATIKMAYRAEMEQLQKILEKKEVEEAGHKQAVAFPAAKQMDEEVEKGNKTQREKRKDDGRKLWKEGETVLYRNEAPSHKFSPRWLGPRKITKVVSEHLVELEGGIRRHSQQIRESGNVSEHATKTKRQQKEKRFEVERIVTHRRNDQNEWEYLVKWVGYDATGNTWEGEGQFDQLKILVDYQKKAGINP